MVSTVAQTLRDVAGPRDGLAFLIEQHRARAALAPLQQPGRLAAARLAAGPVAGRSEGTRRPGAAAAEDRACRTARGPGIAAAAQPHDLPSRQQLLLGREGGRLRPSGRRGLRPSGRTPARRWPTSPSTCTTAWAITTGRSRCCWSPGSKGCSTKAASRSWCNTCTSSSRYGESIAILLPLVERRPDNMQYRVWLMHAYFHTKQPAQLLGAAEANRRALPQGRPLDRGRHGRPGAQLPGEPTLRAVGRSTTRR